MQHAALGAFILSTIVSGCALPIEDGPEAGAWAPDGAFADDADAEANAEAEAETDSESSGSWDPPLLSPPTLYPKPEPAASVSPSRELVAPCGAGIFCADTSITAEKACVLASRARFQEYDDEHFVLGCRQTHDFPANSITPLHVTVFRLSVADIDQPVVAVVTEPDGRRWVTELFNIFTGAGGDETVESLRVHAERVDGRLHVEAELRSSTELWSCTEHDHYWESRDVATNYCTEDAAGDLVCTGRVPLSLIDWEIDVDEDGIETARRRTRYFGFRAEWRGHDLHLTRRSGGLPRRYRAALGTHTVAETAALLRHARRGY